jgi:MFS family permease
MKDHSTIARKITATLFTAQSFASAGFIVSGTVSAIVSTQLSGNPAWAGVPSAVMQIGAALSALLVGSLMDRIGRRWGLTIGLVVGVLGAVFAVIATAMGAFLVFLLGSLLFGVAHAAMRLGRFAAAEVHPPESRGRAISYVVLGGTTGSILGPLLTGPSGLWAVNVGLDELAGPFVVAAVILMLAALTTAIWLRPEPRDVGRAIALRHPENLTHQGPERTTSQILRAPGTLVAVSAMVFGQMVMAMLMGITSLHMKNNQHALADISMVISAHTFGMFAFSILSGRLTDRWGRGPVILSGAGVLVLACLLAPLSTGVLHLAFSLFLLGLGWNLCFVGGSALLSDQLSLVERAKNQGANDLLIGLATSAASLSGGIMYANTSYTVMGMIGAAVALIPLGLTLQWMLQGRRLAGEQSTESSRL